MPEDARRAQLIAAAGEVFLQRGYRATTMDDIAQSAGMSKKTLYQLFATKFDLFNALLCDWFSPCTLPIESDGRPPRDILVATLHRLADFVLSDRQIAMTRLLIAETTQSEDITAALNRQGIGRGKGALEQWLSAQVAHGIFSIDNTEDAANTLFFATVGDFLLGLLLRTRRRPTKKEVAARIEKAVTSFFRDVTESPHVKRRKVLF